MSRSALRMRLLTLALAGCGQPSGYDNDELWGDPTWRSSDFLQISAAWGDDPHVAVSWELIVMKPCCVELAAVTLAVSALLGVLPNPPARWHTSVRLVSD